MRKLVHNAALRKVVSFNVPKTSIRSTLARSGPTVPSTDKSSVVPHCCHLKVERKPSVAPPHSKTL